MAVPSRSEVDAALAGLTQAVGSYSDAPDLTGHMSRVEIIARAKNLIRSVVSAEMTPNYHGLNVRQLSLLSFANVYHDWWLPALY